MIFHEILQQGDQIIAKPKMTSVRTQDGGASVLPCPVTMKVNISMMVLQAGFMVLMSTVAWMFLKMFQYNLTINQKGLIIEKVTETGHSRINTQGNDTEQKNKCSGDKEGMCSHNN